MAGLVPFLHQIRSNPDHIFNDYNPTPFEEQMQNVMRNNLEFERNYRRTYERQWMFAARRFNLLSEKVDDPNISNVLFPLIKTVIMAWLASIMDTPFDTDYRPGPDDEDKVELWKDMRTHVDSVNNTPHIMQEAWLNVGIFGTAVLEDGFQNAYKTHRNEDGSTKIVRDTKNTRIFTHNVSPFHHSISPAGQNQLDAPSHSKVRFYDWDSWAAEFGRVPNALGKPLYSNVGAVRPGEVAMKPENTRTAKARYEFDRGTFGADKVAVITQYIPTIDMMIIESNGVINWIGPNPYKHKQAPFSLMTRIGQLDTPNMQTHSLYGEGFAKSLEGLDAIWQGVGNMIVDSVWMENSGGVSVPMGMNLDIDDIDFYMGTVLEGGNEISSFQLGKISGNSVAFLDVIDRLVIALTGVNINQLTGGDSSTTAFELAQKIRLASKHTKQVMKYNANFGMKKHEELKLSNMFQFMPVEQYADISDVEGIQKLVESGSIEQRDILYENGLPAKTRTFPVVRTKGRVIKEIFNNDGTIDKDKTKVIRKGVDGKIQIRPEILSEEWLRSNGVPEIYVEPTDVVETIKELEAARALKFSVYARERNAEGGNFDLEQIDEDVTRSLGRQPRKYMGKKAREAKKQINGVDTEEVQDGMEAAQVQFAAQQGEQAAQPLPSPQGAAGPEGPTDLSEGLVPER